MVHMSAGCSGLHGRPVLSMCVMRLCLHSVASTVLGQHLIAVMGGVLAAVHSDLLGVVGRLMLGACCIRVMHSTVCMRVGQPGCLVIVLLHGLYYTWA